MPSTQPPNAFAHHPCAHCTNPSTKTCPRCHQSFYCSRACQTTHHKIHKRTCAGLAQAEAEAAAAAAAQQQQSRDDDEENAARRRQRLDNDDDDDARRRRRQHWLDAARAARIVTGFVREFGTREEMWRWVREVN